jgi:peptidoglycan/xylan/chitin deacetylase (PgdA/CDA1 family)
MLASIARHALGLTVLGRSNTRLSVVAYHRVLAEPDPLLPDEPAAAVFEQKMRWLRDVFNVIPLSEGVAGLRSGKLPPRAVAITFDDGYANNATIAAPILARLGLHATFFIASGYLDGGRMFNDTVVEAVRAARGEELDLTSVGLGRHSIDSPAARRRAIAAIIAAIKYEPVEQRIRVSEEVARVVGAPLPTDLMMSSEQAARLAASGFTLGAHTANHPILARLEAGAARREIETGRHRVEELAGQRVGLFAYPNGTPGRDYTAETVRLVREAGFDGAVSASPGAARIGSNPFEIPRATPWDAQLLRFAARMWNNAARVDARYAAA